MNDPDPTNGTITDHRLVHTIASVAGQAAGTPAPTGDVVADVFEHMLTRARTGELVRADDYFGGNDSASVHPDQLLDLVYAEYLAREATGTPPSTTELAARFPHIADRIRRQVELHEALDAEFDSSSFGAISSPPGVSDPTTIGRYRVIAKLGEGGQGTVYRGFHPDLGRDVVIKVARRATPPGAVDVLRAEARVLAALDHPGLARVYDLDTHEGKPFAVMEYVDGRTLDAVAAAEPISPERAARMVADAADAVASAHRRGVIHRDLKPQNIMLDATGRVRVIDFGLARLFVPIEGDQTDAGMISGTVQYMAPEQARGETPTLGPRTDVFGLGAVLYFLLTGSPPYAGGTKLDQLMKASRGEWDQSKLNTPAVPARLRAVCSKALALNPADRYATADELAAALRRAVSPIIGRATAISIAVCVLVAIAFGVWWTNHKPRDSTTVQTPATQPEPVAVVAPSQPKFEVVVWDDEKGKYRNAVYALPLTAGERLRYEADAPANRHLTLFAIEPTGEVRALTTTLPLSEPGKIGYPVNPQESSPLTPPNGTVALLLCGRLDSPVTVEEVRAALGSEAWPVLPSGTLLIIEREKLTAFGGRAVGLPVAQKDTQGDVIRRLDTARAKLKPTCDVLAGAAFSFK